MDEWGVTAPEKGDAHFSLKLSHLTEAQTLAVLALVASEKKVE